MPVILHYGSALSSIPFEERVRRSRMDGCLVIVPTKRRIRHLAREIMLLTPGAVAPALALHTLESFCRSVHAASPGARPIVSGPARTLLFQEAVESVAPSFSYFSLRGNDSVLPRGTFERLADVITHLKESGIYPATLEEELALANAEEQPKLRDVAAVFGAYEQRLAALGIDDPEGVYRYLATGCSQDQFEHSFRTLFPDVDTVSLAGFDEFSLPEISILRKLCAVQRLSVTMMFDYLKGNTGLFGHLEENYRLLTTLGFHEVRTDDEALSAAFFFGVSKKTPDVRSASEHLARSLFARDRRGERADLSSHVTVMAGRNRLHEVELICKLIRRLVAERPDRDLSAICVALHRPQAYTDIMREEFARHDIPVNITDRYELARSPLAVTLLGLLEIPLRGFRREDVLRVIGSPYMTIPSDRPPFDAGNLISVAARVRATAGIRSWYERIDRATARAEEAQAAGPGDPDARRARDELASLRKARIDLESLESVLSPFTEPVTAVEFERRLLLLLENLAVARSVIQPSLRRLPGLMEKDIRAFTAFRDVVRDTTAMVETQGQAGVPQPLHVHLERLKAATGRERYNVREQFGRGVLVTSIEETRELAVDVMIVAGLVDGDFPSVYNPEIFLSARRRKAREQRHAWENRYLFYQAVANWTEHLYLTYPLRDDGIDLVRSSFIDAVLKCAIVRMWDQSDNIPFASDITAREDLLRWFGAASRLSPTPPTAPAGFEEECTTVARASLVEHSRTVSHERKEFEGYVGGSLAGEDILALERVAERVFSASQLETYATCPFRFFAHALLRLDTTGEFQEEMTAAEKGSILHETLFEFFSSRRAQGLPSLRELPPPAFEEAVNQALSIARARLDTLDIPDVFWEIERELILGGEGNAGMLRRFLLYERNREEPVRPTFFEVSFGGTPGAGGNTDAVLSRPDPVPFGSLRLRGKVDRIDIGDGFFSIVDYKTGSMSPGLKDIREGLSLQLPLYLHAVRELLRDEGGHDLLPAGGFYYMLRDDIELKPGIAAEEFRGRAFPSTSRSRQYVRDVEELQRVIDGARTSAERFVASMVRGEFPLTRVELVERVCRSCDFRTVCRIQTQKHVSPKTPEEQ